MTHRPCIAVTTSYNKENKICMSPAYFNAIYKAGGAACFLPRNITDAKSYADEFDGFLFAGGVDVHPSYYGEEISCGSVELDNERDCFEIELLGKVMKTGKPILGICRGIQLINVALGGSLYQHIENHMQEKPKADHSISVSVTESSLLYRITGKKKLLVNSFHHQAVRRVAQGLQVDAFGDDMIAEAVSLEEYGFFLGVQWHPELFYESDTAAADIFRAFVSESGEYKQCLQG